MRRVRRDLMTKLDETVKKETAYIAAWTLILSAIMESAFLVLGLWKPDVLFGNLISGACAVLNFLLMGVTVQKAVDREQEDAAKLMRFSQTMRMFLQLSLSALGVIFFNPVAAVVPLFFPRVAIAFRPLFGVRTESGETAKDEGSSANEED